MNCFAKAEFLRVKRQFLPIHPVLASAKVGQSFMNSKGMFPKVLREGGYGAWFPKKILCVLV